MPRSERGLRRSAPAVGVKLRGHDKVRLLSVQEVQELPSGGSRKPPWIRARVGNSAQVERIRSILREYRLSSVCEEASCPNLGECFGKGTATFMIMGDICTRRCAFCDVAHGRPLPLDPQEPQRLAHAIARMGLQYVVITSVDRDDLKDGGARHFVDCIEQTRRAAPGIVVEVLVPDFRNRVELALEAFVLGCPDVFNHNLETVPRLYRRVRPGAVYRGSLQLLQDFHQAFPQIPTKSGLMLGLGESMAEVLEVMGDLRDHGVAMLTLGQYLQPGPHHLPVQRWWSPEEFAELAREGLAMGFDHVASGPLVRSSYHADQQAGAAAGRRPEQVLQ